MRHFALISMGYFVNPICTSVLVLFASLSLLMPNPAFSADELPSTLPIKHYFVAVPDLRKCASPMCGGAWVSKVNRNKMKCPDGTQAERCYVWDVEFEPLTDQNIVDGKTLIQGNFEPTTFSNDLTFYKLVANTAYSPLFDENPTRGFFGLLYNTGIVCITDPCPSIKIQKLNKKREANVAHLHFKRRFNEEHKDWILEQSYDEGALVYGRIKNSTETTAGYVDFKVANAYQAIKETNEMICGGFIGLVCDRGDYCFFEPSATCGFADQTGTCQPIPDACIEIYQPVCGCDGITYSNSCFAATAGISVLHTGACTDKDL
ncbi:MAG: Kazal-type serine protease inhibitor family protein [Pseudomonadales bacterium]|nr:Kazal-type serine protease inhibitor family protein [Pseudomonadales bacterium]